MTEKPRRPHAAQTPEEVLEDEITELEQPTVRSWMSWVGAIGGLLVLVVVITLLVGWEQNRRSGRPAGIRGLDSQLLVPRGDLPEAPRAFQWNRVDGAASYVVTIQTGRGETLMVRPVDGTLLAPLDIELAQLLPGDYTWTVEARGREGAVVGRGRAAFRITSPP